MNLERTVSRSNDILRRAADAFPGGVLGSFALNDQELVVDRGHGARVNTVDGREYVDCLLGSGPLILGHAHSAVVEAIARQAARGTTFYALNEPAVMLAERILAVFPPSSQMLFTSSGAEATFYAIRLARAHTGRDLVVKFAGAYHGHHDYAIVEPWARDWEAQTAVNMGSAGVPAAAADTVLVAPFNDLDAVADLFQAHGDRIAAVIVEPYQRVIPPVDGFLPGVQELANRSGALLVADEVVTGFRMTYGTAQEVYGFRADLTALGKVIGGGLPLAAVVGRANVLGLADHRRSKSSEYVYISGTLSGNALAAAAGLATLEQLSAEGTYERLGAAGQVVRDHVERAFARNGAQVYAAGIGPMFHAVVCSSPPRSAADVAASDRQTALAFGRSLISHGVLVNPMQRSYLSTAHDEEVLATMAAAIDAAADGVLTGVPRPA